MTRRVRLVWATVFLVGLAMTSILLLWPHAPVPPRAGRWVDKLAHLGMFACLGLAAALALPRAPRWRLVLALALYGALVELVQPAVGRNREALDLVADALGAAAAWLIPRDRRGG